MEATAKARERIGQVLTSENLGDTIAWIAEQPAHVNLAEVLVLPTGER